MTTHDSTILIVDDEPIGRRILEMLLSDQNYALVSASSGAEALARAAELPPDLVLLDIMMPDMDGFEVCRRLRADALLAEVPVVMVTALDDRESRLQGIDAGADDFITKPVDRVELQKRVQTIVRLDRYRRLTTERGQRQQAEEEIRRRNRELTLLNHVIATAAATLDIEAVLRLACESLVQAFALPYAAALRLAPEHQQAQVVARYQSPAVPNEQPAPSQNEAEPPIPLVDVPALLQMTQHKQPRVFVASENTAEPDQADLHDLRLLLHTEAVVTLLLVPVLVRNTISGCLLLAADSPRLFAEDDRVLALSVATAVGQAIERAELYHRLQRHADQLEATVAQRTLELKLERDRTQAILEALGDGVIVTDMEGRVHYMNPAAAHLTGFTSEQVQGQTWNVFWENNEPPDYFQSLQACVQQGDTWRGEVVNRHRDGTLYDAAMTVAPISDPHALDHIVGIVSVQRDITPLKEAERMKDQFVSNVSHELRTPLSVITLLSGNLDTLYKRLDDAKRQKMIRDIRAHTQVLNDLISSVLEISRIDSRRISSQHQPIDLGQLTREEAEKQSPLAQKKSQTLAVGGDETLMVMGNDGQLRQVIRNIVNNAIKYTPVGGLLWCEQYRLQRGAAAPVGLPADPDAMQPLRDVWPGIENLPDGTWATVRITDTGIGIDAEYLPHLFQRFYRVQTQGTIPGTGLGLAIAQELITLHSGLIAIASEAGRGSVVVIYLPLREETT